MQYKANIQQRNDIAIERFESNLFEMIHIQQEIINGLLIEDNLRCELLASDRDRELYSKKLSPNYSYQEDEDRNMDMEYKKSAFVHRAS